MRRRAVGEEPVADDWHAPPAGAARPRLRQQADLAQALGPPVLGQPGEGRGIGRAEHQDGIRHRQQRVQIERAGAARSDQADRLRVMRLDALRGTDAPGCGSRRSSAAAAPAAARPPG